jgi:C1A family cysteine protease
MQRKYGWKRDRLDHRDHFMTVTKRVPLPASADLRSGMPAIYDQGELGSCTANAIAAAVDFERGKQGLQFMSPSRLFIYWNERSIEGTVSQDSGAEIRDGIKTVAAQGVCQETEWPYNIGQFTVKPTAQCFTDAKKFEATQYSRVTQDSYFPRHCMGILGRPVVLGIAVFNAIESDQVAATGDVPMPSPMDQPIGGHAVLVVGYNDATRKFIFRNSWGSDWGNHGYGTLPYDYVLSPALCSDLWTILAETNSAV